MTTPDPLAPATRCVALGRPHAPGEPVNPPVVFSSTFVHGGPHTYARETTPAYTPFEEAVGALEGGRALVLASGMAAAAAVLSLVPHGGVVLTPRSAYMGVLTLMREAAADGRVVLREVDLTDAEAVEQALPGADLVWLESPGNPLMEVADLPRLLAAALDGHGHPDPEDTLEVYVEAETPHGLSWHLGDWALGHTDPR